MWFLADPDKRTGISDSFLQKIQTRDHFIFSYDNDFSFPRRAISLDKTLAHVFYKRFIACDFVRLGSGHGNSIAPHVAINHMDDQNASILYYVGPPDEESCNLQFVKDMPMIKAVFFFEDKARIRLYLPFNISGAANKIPSIKYEQGRYFVERD